MAQLSQLFIRAAELGELGQPLVREVSDDMAACAADKHPELGGLVPPESFQAMIQAWATLHGYHLPRRLRPVRLDGRRGPRGAVRQHPSHRRAGGRHPHRLTPMLRAAAVFSVLLGLGFGIPACSGRSTSPGRVRCGPSWASRPTAAARSSASGSSDLVPLIAGLRGGVRSRGGGRHRCSGLDAPHAALLSLPAPAVRAGLLDRLRAAVRPAARDRAHRPGAARLRVRTIGTCRPRCVAPGVQRLLTGPAPVVVVVAAALAAGALPAASPISTSTSTPAGGAGRPAADAVDPETGLLFTYPPFAAAPGAAGAAARPRWWPDFGPARRSRALAAVVVLVRRTVGRPAPGWLVALLAGGALALEPVWQNLVFGQTNLLLMLAVLVDLLRPERRWSGVLVASPRV